MPTGNFIGTVDLALISLYAFWIFFFGLIVYLRREDKREGYPLVTDNPRSIKGTVFAPPPRQVKTFSTTHGEVVSGRVDQRDINLSPSEPWSGAPFDPTGDPMLDGVGPASYAERADVPEKTLSGEISIVPLRVATDHFVEPLGPNPIGMEVVAADGVVAGHVTDVWVDRAEIIVRYLEVEVGEEGAAHKVLLPMPFATVDAMNAEINVKAITAEQFKSVPTTASPDQVTLLEEDKITGYFGGGYLYAWPERAEPLI
ncbi:MAG: photosynthetic reaction center subunit H [Alphaproteobacteria bacterium]